MTTQKIAVPEDTDKLLYGLEDKPPLGESLFVASQHMLASFVGIITPGLIVSNVLELDPDTTSHLVSMALFVSGLCTFIQCRKIGPVGSGLLSMQGTSFGFLGPILGVSTAAVQAGATPIDALTLVFGACFLGSFVEITLSRFLHLAKKIITPVVTGTVVTIIGLSLLKTGMTSIAGGTNAIKDGTFGSTQNIALGGLVILIIVLLNMSSNRYLKMGAIAIGLAVGYLVSTFLGIVDFSLLSKLPIFRLPLPMRYGMTFDIAALIPLAILYVITAIETIGDLTATSLFTNQPIRGGTYIRRIKGGVLGDGINSMLAAIFNTLPVTTFSQNNGVIKMTGVGSRYVGFYTAAIFAILGLFPIVGGFLQIIPQPVLGGATTVIFGTIAVGGMGIIMSSKMTRRSTLIVALSLALGLGVIFVPDLLKDKPQIIKNVFSSAVPTGGLTAILLNAFLPRAPEDRLAEAEEDGETEVLEAA